MKIEMAMKKIIFLLLIFQACSIPSEKQGIVQITIDPDPAKIGEVSLVKLHVDHKMDMPPDFFILHRGDTGQLDFKSEMDCAILELVNDNPGSYKYNGFVNFFDKDSIEQTTVFNIEFKVEE